MTNSSNIIAFARHGAPRGLQRGDLVEFDHHDWDAGDVVCVGRVAYLKRDRAVVRVDDGLLVTVAVAACRIVGDAT